MKIINQVKKLVNYYIPSMPAAYWIDTTAICNLRCVMCFRSKNVIKRQAKMPLEMFRCIIDSVCTNRPLIKLYMSGEPLLHDRLFEMIEYASAQGCKTMIHTNATLLNEEVSKKLLDSSLTYLSFSFDGCTPDIFERLRPPAKFIKVKSNIKEYLNLRKKLNVRGPHTTVEIIKMKDTAELVPEFVSEWERSGIDNVATSDCMTWLDTVNDRRIEVPPNYGYKPCVAPFRSSAILSDGTVVPCCMDVYGKLPLGNVTQNTFRDIWFGPEYTELRKRMLTGKIPKESICYKCHETFCRSRIERFYISIPRFFAFVDRMLFGRMKYGY